MVEGCGLKCVKYSLFAFNLIFWLIGCAILAVGIWFLVDTNQFIKFADNASLADSKAFLLGIGISVVVLGSIIMITGFLGCCGAVRESQCMLGTFFVILFLIFAAMVTLGVIALVQQQWLKDAIKQIMDYEVKQSVQTGIMEWANTKYGCCGITSMTKCDKTYPPSNKCQSGSPACANGCLDALWNNILGMAANGAGIALLVTCGVLLLGMFFSMCLCCQIRG